jgi:hypothetical protein
MNFAGLFPWKFSGHVHVHGHGHIPWTRTLKQKWTYTTRTDILYKKSPKPKEC